LSLSLIAHSEPEMARLPNFRKLAEATAAFAANDAITELILEP
jgi:hypothetical protein